MTIQPTQIIVATDDPGRSLYFHKMLYFSGFDAEPVRLHPQEALVAVDPCRACLVLVDANSAPASSVLAWAMRQSPESRFVLYHHAVTPDILLKAVESGVHGVLSTSLGIAEGARMVSRVWNGERLFRFNCGAPIPSPPRALAGDFDSEWMFGHAG